MKKVVDSRQVAHLWANRSQDEGRNAGGNFYFTGPAIYSYGSHFVIAAFLDNGTVVINDATYGVTTSRHQSYARNALAHSKWQDAIHVPKLNEDLWRNLDRCIREADGKRVPTVIQEMANAAQNEILGMVGARFSGKLERAFYAAKQLEANAMRILQLCAKGKRVPKWPLAALPDELPRDNEARAAFIASYSRAKLIAEYQKTLAICGESLAALQSEFECDETEIRGRWSLNNIPGKIDHLQRVLYGAQAQYKAIHKRNSAAVTAMQKALDKIETPLRALYAQFTAEHARHELNSLVRQAYSEIRKINAISYWGIRPNHVRHCASKMADAIATMQAAQMDAGFAEHAFARIQRVADWHADVESLKAADRAIVDAASYLPNFAADALRCLNTAKRHALNCTLTGHAYFADKRSAMLAKIEGTAAPIRAAIKAKNESAVSDWVKGERQSLPHDAGTYARIQGDEMVTSRGARVPLVHACRLARIARRVIAHGGKVWPDGSGPIVGGFRVQAIRVDGSATIGCHEFEGDEGMRLLALLDACECCAEISETAEV